MDDVQRLEAERLRPVTPACPLDELFRELIGLLAGLCADAEAEREAGRSRAV